MYGVPLRFVDKCHIEHPHISGVPSLDACCIPCATRGALYQPLEPTTESEPSDVPGLDVYPAYRWDAGILTLRELGSNYCFGAVTRARLMGHRHLSRKNLSAHQA